MATFFDGIELTVAELMAQADEFQIEASIVDAYLTYQDRVVVCIEKPPVRFYGAIRKDHHPFDEFRGWYANHEQIRFLGDEIVMLASKEARQQITNLASWHNSPKIANP